MISLLPDFLHSSKKQCLSHSSESLLPAHLFLFLWPIVPLSCSHFCSIHQISFSLSSLLTTHLSFSPIFFNPSSHASSILSFLPSSFPCSFPDIRFFSLSSSPYILHPHHFISLSCLFVSQLTLFILICYFSSSISSYSFFLTNLSPLTLSPPCLNSYPTCTLYSPPSFLLSFTSCSF